MDRATAKQLVAALSNDAELAHLLAQSDAVSCPTTTTMAAMGTPYELAGVPIDPPAISHIAQLAVIDSPLLSMDGEEISLMDCWRALWAITSPPAAMAPVLGLEGRMASCHRFASRYPDQAEPMMRLVAQEAAKAWARVDEAALSLSGQYPGATAQDVSDLIVRMLADARQGWERLPRDSEGESPAEKKTSETFTTAIGSGECSTTRQTLESRSLTRLSRALQWLVSGWRLLRTSRVA